MAENKSSIGTIVLILVVAIMAFTLLRTGQLTGYAGTYTETNQSEAKATIGNANPTVTSVIVIDTANENGANNITLYGGVTKYVSCNGTVDDTNGWDDLASVSAEFFKNSSGPGGGDNNNNHYTPSCSLTGTNTSNTARSFYCETAVQWNADPALWNCTVTVTDKTAATGKGDDTATILSLTALNVDPTLDFGSLALGATSSSDVSHTVFNYGNIQIDVKLSGSSGGLDCASPSTADIPIGNLHYNCTDTGQDYTTGMTALTNISSDLGCTTFNLAKSTSAGPGPSTASEKETNWKIQIPTTGVVGLCNGTVWFIGEPG